MFLLFSIHHLASRKDRVFEAIGAGDSLSCDLKTCSVRNRGPNDRKSERHDFRFVDANAVDYLLKPIRKDRLANALSKARKLTSRQTREISQARPEPQARTHISVHLRGNIRLVPVPDILYFVADSKYVVVRTPTEEHLIEDSLVNLEKEFGERFLRIHRSTLVAKNHIEKLSRNSEGQWVIHLRDHDHPLEISRRLLTVVRKQLKQSRR